MHFSCAYERGKLTTKLQAFVLSVIVLPLKYARFTQIYKHEWYVNAYEIGIMPFLVRTYK